MSKKIKNISIIGLGLIGGSIAKTLKKNKDNNYIISAYDKPDVLDKAKKEKIIEKKLSNFEDAINSDLIFLCLPLEKNLEFFTNLAPKLKQNSILTDVSGIKLTFKKKWDTLNSKGIYIGGHPMTGKEKGGYVPIGFCV